MSQLWGILESQYFITLLFVHSAEEDNLSPFDQKIACLHQSIAINNKHVYRQSQVRKPTGKAHVSAVGNSWTTIFYHIVICAFSRGRQLVSFRSKNCLPAPEHQNKQQTCISPESGAKANRQWGRVGWMLTDHRYGLLSSKFLAWS